jgi:glycosyltransferase involved in cell wall biosynthesis
MKVSVSVTTYNHERYIAQALDGVLAQVVDFDYEIVVGDDRSQDRTRDIVLDYQARHPDRIRTVLPAENLGRGGKPMFAATLEPCRGDYIAFLDGDDYWTAPDKLARQVRFLDEHPDASMCYHNVMRVHEDGSAPDVPHNPLDQRGFTSLAEILGHCMVAACSPLFRREALVPLPSWYDAVPFGDWPLYIVAATRGRIGYIDDLMGVYRIHPAGAWSGVDALEQARQLVAFHETLAALPEPERPVGVRRSLGLQYFRLAREYASTGQLGLAQRYAWRAARLGPGRPRPSWRELGGLLLKVYRLRLQSGWRDAAAGRGL